MYVERGRGIFGRVKKLLVKITSKKILSKTDQELRNCGLSWAKVGYIKDLANQVMMNGLQVTELDKLPDDEVRHELIAVKGIGPWTAEMFLMFSLTRPDIFPKNDLGINKAMTKLKLTSSDRWKPYRTVASWYLWRSLENR